MIFPRMRNGRPFLQECAPGSSDEYISIITVIHLGLWDMVQMSQVNISAMEVALGVVKAQSLSNDDLNTKAICNDAECCICWCWTKNVTERS